MLTWSEVLQSWAWIMGVVLVASALEWYLWEPVAGLVRRWRSWRSRRAGGAV